MPKKILIIDDEIDMSMMLKRYFELNGYDVSVAANGLQGIEKAGKQPDLILLDINMPDLDGLEVCQRIRGFVSCPILFLTARIEDHDKLKGFAVGGDDYIVKPFSIDELGARVDAHLRREERRQNNQVRTKFDDDLVIDYTAKEVYFKGKPLPLLPKEFAIVELLSTYPGQLFSKDRIFEHIWDMDSNADEHTVEVHIGRLRDRFRDCSDFEIRTIRGFGYMGVPGEGEK